MRVVNPPGTTWETSQGTPRTSPPEPPDERALSVPNSRENESSCSGRHLSSRPLDLLLRETVLLLMVWRIREPWRPRRLTVGIRAVYCCARAYVLLPSLPKR